MADRVRYEPLSIDLDLSQPDLGHPGLPGLWDALLKLRPIRDGVLCCIDCWERKGRAEWMYLREPEGRREAVHRNPAIGSHRTSEGESDEHKALKERYARKATEIGLRVTVEARAAHGKRITDLLIEGAGKPLGCEFQLSTITAQTIRRRADIARSDGITPFWTTDSLEVPLQHRAPWSRIGKTTAARIANGTQMLVTGGVQVVESELCGRRHPRCPVTSRRPCGQLHLYTAPARGVHLDDLILGAATGRYQLRELTTRRGKNFWWMPAADLERLLDDRSGAQAPDDDAAPAGPRPVASCHYRGLRVSEQTPMNYQPTPGQCGAGQTPCGADARLYPGGWRCDEHRPSTPIWERH